MPETWQPAPISMPEPAVAEQNQQLLKRNRATFPVPVGKIVTHPLMAVSKNVLEQLIEPTCWPFPGEMAMPRPDCIKSQSVNWMPDAHVSRQPAKADDPPPA